MTNQEARDECIKIAAFAVSEKQEKAMLMAIKALEQEPKTGHREYNDIYDHYLCGNCKTIVMDYDNFCPNCGAKMTEQNERSE